MFCWSFCNKTNCTSKETVDTDWSNTTGATQFLTTIEPNIRISYQAQLQNVNKHF